MPIYEYFCQNCQHQLDAFQKMSDPALSLCPECKQHTLQKQISAAAFRLKGTGWYETDFKTGDKKNNLVSSENTNREPTAKPNQTTALNETKKVAKESQSITSNTKTPVTSKDASSQNIKTVNQTPSKGNVSS